MNPRALNLGLAPNSLDNILQTVCLELAIGGSLPAKDFSAWPLGLVVTWNECAESGALDGCQSLGDMARAFLAWQIKTLDARKARRATA